MVEGRPLQGEIWQHGLVFLPVQVVTFPG